MPEEMFVFHGRSFILIIARRDAAAVECSCRDIAVTTWRRHTTLSKNEPRLAVPRTRPRASISLPRAVFQYCAWAEPAPASLLPVAMSASGGGHSISFLFA